MFADERVDAAPDVPTSIEQGFTTTASWWGGVFAPKGIPADAKTTLVDACRKTSESERFAETLNGLGTLVLFKDSDGVKQAVEEGSETNGAIIERVLK